MKTRVIIASAFTVLSLGIVTRVFAASTPTEEPPVVNKVETISTANKEGVTPPVATTETPVPVEAEKAAEAAPTVAPSHLSKDEISTKIATIVPQLWNPKETGIMISSGNISQLLLRSYDASPESFTESSANGIITSCVDRIKTMNQVEAQTFVSSDTCL